MKIRITDDRYDNTGMTYEFDSIESFVDEMMPTLKTWAAEKFQNDLSMALRESDIPSKNENLKEMVIELKTKIEVITD